tara:strand:- start:423 stop:1262 length:840 start_codon:yes stop_codon:yes gene_type:complete
MIEVLHPGIYCSVQDQGRFGLAKQGIPQAGYADSYAAGMANILLKNNKKDAVIEITFGQGEFKFHSATHICITGGDFSPKLNGKLIDLQIVYTVAVGMVLSFSKRVYGARTYLAVEGGIQSETVMGSRSFSQGITQQKLKKGMMMNILPIQDYLEKLFSKVRVAQAHFTGIHLPCFTGPEYSQLNKLQQAQLQELFSISADNNRVGYRLQEILENKLPSILTSAVIPGTVQLTPSGKLIILMQDCQVTGGYPRVLQLSEMAICRLSQKITGEAVKFVIK